MGAEELVIRWGNLKKFQEDLDTVGKQAADIEKYARDQVFCKDGFEFKLCVLQPLADVMDVAAGVFEDLRTTFDSRWEDLATALDLTANDVKNVDDTHASGYNKFSSDLGGH